MLAAALVGAWVLPAGAAQLPAAEDPDSLSNPWLDETAKRLILGARAARDTALLAIDGYTAVLRERVAIEIPYSRRTATFLEGEFASRIRWSMGEPTVVRLLGSRTRSPFLPTERTDTVWSPMAGRYAADPMRDPFSFAVLGASGGRPRLRELIRSPLEEGAERYYRFQSGDTLTITLPGGESVRAVRVTAIPRVRSIRLVSAFLWIEPESFGLARVAYRLAKAIDDEISWFAVEDGNLSLGARLRMPGDQAEVEGPGADSAERAESNEGIGARILNAAFHGFMPPTRLDVRAVVADYELRDLRYWLPRAVRWEGTARVGEEVLVDGRPSLAWPLRRDWAFEIEEIREAGAAASATAQEVVESWRKPGDRIVPEPEDAEPEDALLLMPRNRSALLSDEHLPAPLLAEDIGAYGAGSVDRLANELARITPAGTGGTDAESLRQSNPWSFDPPVQTVRLLRYNDFEGVSVGARVARYLGSTWTSLTVRAGTRSRQAPDVLLTLSRRVAGARAVGSAYRRLGIPGGGLFVRDAQLADYSWSHGVGLTLIPDDGQRNWISLGTFAERQTELDGNERFDRYGAEVALRPWWGAAPDEPGGGFNANARVVRGDNPHLKATVTGATVLPLVRGLSLGLEAGAAGLWGEPLRRDFWQLGGTGAWLRGHKGVAPSLQGHAGILRARTVWRGRADVKTRIPQFGPLHLLGPLSYRLSVFADWARASGVDHAAWGVGLAAPDGLLRLDLARGIRLGTPGLTLPAKWRVHLLFNRFF